MFVMGLWATQKGDRGWASGRDPREQGPLALIPILTASAMRAACDATVYELSLFDSTARTV